jgi:hypothetical protein
MSCSTIPENLSGLENPTRGQIVLESSVPCAQHGITAAYAAPKSRRRMSSFTLFPNNT